MGCFSDGETGNPSCHAIPVSTADTMAQYNSSDISRATEWFNRFSYNEAHINKYR